MKLILSEAVLSNHFFERLNSRLPNTVSNNFKMSKELDGNIALVQNLIFPKEKFIINVLKLNKYYVCVVVKHNQIATTFLSKKLTFDNSFEVFDIVKFSEEVNYIRSEKMELGLWAYKYVDSGTRAPFYFLVKNRIIVKTISESDLPLYNEYKFYSID